MEKKKEKEEEKVLAKGRFTHSMSRPCRSPAMPSR
jgi:hypothetical protein